MNLFNFLRKAEASKQRKPAPRAGKDEAERRKFLRLPTIFPVDYQIIDTQNSKPLTEIFQSFTGDVSEGGMCLEVINLKEEFSRRLASGEAKLSLSIEAPFSKKPISATGAVRWFQKIEGDIPGKYLLGVDYEAISETERKKITKFARIIVLRPKLILAAFGILILVSIFTAYRVVQESKAKQAAQKAVAELQEAQRIEGRLKELESIGQALQKQLTKISGEKSDIESKISEFSQAQIQTGRIEELKLRVKESEIFISDLQDKLQRIAQEAKALNLELLELKGPSAVEKKPPERVKTAQVSKEDFEDLLPTMGTIRGDVEVDLKFAVNGSIKEFNFKDGESVNKGELISALEDDDASVKHKYAELRLEEYQRLYEIGGIIESKLKQVQLEEELAKIELEKTCLRAPFNGVINNRKADKGKFVTPNDRVATFSGIDEVVAEVGIIEKDVDKIKLGQKAIIKVDAYPDIDFEGVVDTVSSSFEGKSRTLTARIKLANPKQSLLPGMFARAIIYTYKKDAALVIPVMALEKKEAGFSVLVVGKDAEPDGALIAKERKVEIDYLSFEKAVIGKGLEEGEQVVVWQEKEVKDGDQVEVIKE